MKMSCGAPVKTTAPIERSPSRDRVSSSSSRTITPVMKLRGGLSSRATQTRPFFSTWTVFAAICPPSARSGRSLTRAWWRLRLRSASSNILDTVRVLMFHGYLLRGTGSNVYNAELAEALARLGHEGHLLCQDPSPAALG